MGNRERIKVWADPSLPGTQSPRVLSPRGGASADLKVGELINPTTCAWNVDLLDQLLLPFERDRILSIPLSMRMPEDVLCWDLERNGQYSVRSAYRALFGDEWASDEVATSNPTLLWRKVWQTKVLPRVKVPRGEHAWKLSRQGVVLVEG